MAYDRFLIAPINSGLQKDLESWLIPDDAFAELNNAYVWRGRVRKRFGSMLMGTLGQRSSRLRIALTGGAGVGITDAVTGNATGLVSTSGGGTTYKVGQMFSIGEELFTVTALGAPAAMLISGATTTATYNTTTGAFNFVGATPATQIYFYPAEPVMGLTNYEVGAINNQPAVAFDTQFAYEYSGTAWERMGTAYWRGANNNFVWTCNWRGVTSDIPTLFSSNFKVVSLNGPGDALDDPIWWYDRATGWHSGFDPATGFPIAPGVNGSWYFAPTGAGAANRGPYVRTARIIVPFKNRLLLLNTVENTNPGGGGAVGVNIHYGNRCRYSINGSPFATYAWYEPRKTDGVNVPMGAGWVDAPVEENIISAEFIKDRLIVYFEQSTFELAYTGNAIKPFVWQQLNCELGSQAQFSTVPFDKVILTVGNTGVHACNGSNVERVDEKIPNEVFKIKNKNEGVERVAGVRDYYTEMVYWAFPATEGPENFVYPTRVLVYNYRNGSWALNDDCFTCFGYFEQQADVIWSDCSLTWAEYEATWTSGVLQSQFRQIIGGNQEGFVTVINADLDNNAPALQISRVQLATPAAGLVTLTIRDHTIPVGSCISLSNMNGLTITGDPLYIVVAIDVATHEVIIDTDFSNSTITGTYTGGGLAARVSNPKMLTKQFNPYIKEGKNVYLAKVDFYVQKTAAAEITVDYYPSSSTLSMINAGTISGAQTGSNILETSAYAAVPFEAVQNKVWHPIYFQTVGESVQLCLSLSNEQLVQAAIARDGFKLDGMVLYTMPISRLE